MKRRYVDEPETLVYIGQMLDELQKLARKTDHPLLAYMIEMASQEAHDQIEERQKH